MIALWIAFIIIAAVGLGLMFAQKTDKKKPGIFSIVLVCVVFGVVLFLASFVPNGQSLDSLKNGAVYTMVTQPQEEEICYDTVLFLLKNNELKPRSYRIPSWKLRDENLIQLELADIPKEFIVFERNDTWIPGRSNMTERIRDVYILIPKTLEEVGEK